MNNELTFYNWWKPQSSTRELFGYRFAGDYVSQTTPDAIRSIRRFVFRALFVATKETCREKFVHFASHLSVEAPSTEEYRKNSRESSLQGLRGSLLLDRFRRWSSMHDSIGDTTLSCPGQGKYRARVRRGVEENFDSTLLGITVVLVATTLCYSTSRAVDSVFSTESFVNFTLCRSNYRSKISNIGY